MRTKAVKSEQQPDLLSMMNFYIEKFGLPVKMDASEFITQYFTGIEEKVLSGVRLPLPMNLGYIQGLEHLYAGDEKAHLNKFGNLDYSVIWMKHPMFRYHSIKTDDALNDRLKQAKMSGAKIMDDYVEGDYYIVRN